MRALRVTAAIGLMTLVGGALTAGVASAQDSGASITVEQTHPTGTGAHYFVRVSGSADSATVTATATSPDGKAGDPVTLDPGGEPGLFQGGVDMPDDGTWTVTFTSKNPDATLELSQKVPVEAQTEGSSGSGSSGSGGSGGSDEPSPVGPLIFAGLFVVALIAMGIWALIERGKTPTSDAPADGGDADDPAVPGDEASITASTE